MGRYIDGFVLPIPSEHLDEYKSTAATVAEIWKEHGALAYFEFVGDDLMLEGTRSFTECVDSKKNEVIIFGWVLFDSKETRDKANKLVVSDPRMPGLIDPLMMPSKLIFDASRMIYGGFKPLVETE